MRRFLAVLAFLALAFPACAGTSVLGTVEGTLPCAQHPALTGDVTTSAGSCATAVGNVPNAATIQSDAIFKTVGTITSEVDVTSSTTLTSLGLSCALTAGKTYLVVGHLSVSTTSTPGAKMGFVASGGLSVTSMTRLVRLFASSSISSVFTATSLDTTSGGAGATANITDIDFSGIFVVNAAGTLNFEGAQNTSSGAAAAKFLVNSWAKCERIN